MKLAPLVNKRVQIIKTGMDLPFSFEGLQGRVVYDAGLEAIGLRSEDYYIALDNGDYCFAPRWKLKVIDNRAAI